MSDNMHTTCSPSPFSKLLVWKVTSEATFIVLYSGPNAFSDRYIVTLKQYCETFVFGVEI